MNSLAALTFRTSTFFCLYLCIVSLCLMSRSIAQTTSDQTYQKRFTSIRDELNKPNNGYFSPDNGPYYAAETFIFDGTDHGHVSNSETYSYLLWLEAWHGKLTGDWQPLKKAWEKMESHTIPTSSLQPQNQHYQPETPSLYQQESPSLKDYPLPLKPDADITGSDPLSTLLAKQYRNKLVYSMHRYLDLDNLHGYGNQGDGISTPALIQYYRRGPQETLWQTVPQPAWDDFSWGGPNGYSDLIIPSHETPFWHYTSSTDANARTIQIIYWAQQWIQEQGKQPEKTIPDILDNAAKMGDYLRLAMFDKHFKTIGVQNETEGAGKNYESAHYLLSKDISWGCPITKKTHTCFRSSSNHIPIGHQNPVTAYALSRIPELTPGTPGAKLDWATNLDRTLEFLQWTQSSEGAFVGGATNNWNGHYAPYPHAAQFYGLAYKTEPTQQHRQSDAWFGWQTRLGERLTEYYYITGNKHAKQILTPWIQWVLLEKPKNRLPVIKKEKNHIFIANNLAINGLPAPWNPQQPATNHKLQASVTGYNQDVGVAHNLAKALLLYSAAESKWSGQVHAKARDTAQSLLDYFWEQHRTEKGVSAPEKRPDYKHIHNTVHFPVGWQGTNAQGADLSNGASFFSLRPFLANDPNYLKLKSTLAKENVPEYRYHRFWAQIEVATANALFSELKPELFRSPKKKKTNKQLSRPETKFARQQSTDLHMASTSNSTSPSKAPIKSALPAQPPNSKCSVSFHITNTWSTGYSANVTLANIGKTTLNGYQLTWPLIDGEHVRKSWDASFTFSDSHISASNRPDHPNGTIQPGESVSFGYIGASTLFKPVTPTQFILNGKPCLRDTLPEAIQDNQPPTAHFIAQPAMGNDPLLVIFDAAQSHDKDSDTLTYQWDFGDGETGAGIQTSHTYIQPGQFTATLSISDGDTQQQHSALIQVHSRDKNPSACEYEVLNEWATGFVANISITNHRSSPVDDWRISWQYPDDTQIEHPWNADIIGNNPYTASASKQNRTLLPAQSITFGFQGIKHTSRQPATIPIITGTLCQPIHSS